MDGLGHLGFMREVALPLVRPTLGALALFSFLGTWNQYLWPNLITTEEDMNTVQTGLRLAELERARTSTRSNLPIAGTVIAALPIALVLIVFQRQLVRGLTAGSGEGMMRRGGVVAARRAPVVVVLRARCRAACGEGGAILERGQPPGADDATADRRPRHRRGATDVTPGRRPRGDDERRRGRPPGATVPTPGCSDAGRRRTRDDVAPATDDAAVDRGAVDDEPTLLDTLPPCPVDALAAAGDTVEITFWHGMTVDLERELDRLDGPVQREPVEGPRHAPEVDWNVIFLLLGMMIIVGVLRQTGVFEFLAIWAAKRAKGSPLRVMILLVPDHRGRVGVPGQRHHRAADGAGDTAGLRPAGLPPVPFLIAEVFASNIGGAATLIGDPPNIIIGSRAGLAFNEFLVQHGPDRADRAGRVPGHAADAVPRLVRRRPGPAWRRHGAERARGDRRPPAADQVRRRAAAGVRRLRRPLGHSTSSPRWSLCSVRDCWC